MARRRSSLTVRIGLELADRRKAAGISQEAFAAACGLHRTYVSQLERGLKAPTVTTLEAVAKTLQVAVWELLRCAEERD